MSSSTPGDAPSSTTSRLLRTLIPLAFLAAVVAFAYHGRSSFQWSAVIAQLRSADPLHILIGIALIYACYWLRAMRWSVLLRTLRPASAARVFPAQVIGFTAVGLFGRLADLARPVILARTLDTSVATQLAVYSVERAFDLAAAAVLFSAALAFGSRSLPHHEAFAHVGLLAIAATVVLVLFALALRLRGPAIARTSARLLHKLSPRLAALAEARLLDLSAGFHTLATFAEFASATALSLIMWIGVAAAYVVSIRAFRAAPSLASFGLAATMLLLATGMGGSLLQLPVLGWFTQIAVLAAALHGIFAVPLDTATACGLVLLLVANLSIIPLGLLLAHARGLSLRAAARASEDPAPPAAPAAVDKITLT
jgi:hypothetical protein